MLLWFLLSCTLEEISTRGDQVFPEGVAPSSMTLDQVWPTRSPVEGQAAVCVIGSGFDDPGLDVWVTIDGEACAEQIVLGDTQISCRTPEGVEGETTLHVDKDDYSHLEADFLYTDGPPAVPVDFCRMYSPCNMRGELGEVADDPQRLVLVQVQHAGLTEAAGASAGLRVEVGWGPDDSRPHEGCWSWFPTDYVGESVVGEQDYEEHAGALTLPEEPAPGGHDYVGRVSLDDGRSWLYCDLGGGASEGCPTEVGGSGNGYSTLDAGQLTLEF